MIRRIVTAAREAKFGTLFLEVFVLVIGILLALAIDQWRQDRDDRRAEREYLMTLRADLESDLGMLEERIFPEIDYRLEIAESLRAFTADTVPESLEAQREFVNDISIAGIMSTYEPRRAAIDDMLATGNLRLIQNRELRLRLINFYSRIISMRPYDEWARDLIWQGYRNEVTGFIPLEAVHMSAEGRDAASREAMVAIVESEIFQRGLLNVRFMANWQKSRYQGVRDDIAQLIDAIDAELGPAQ